jgi:translation elongation factor EF-1beta
MHTDGISTLPRTLPMKKQSKSFFINFRFKGTKKALSSYGPAEETKAEAANADDDFDLFESDAEEDAEAEKIKQQRLEEYRAKKATKPQVIAKSSIVLDVKPWDDETDMKELEKGVREITMDGLVWGQGKLVAVGYGIKKLQIGCVVEDDKVAMDDLEERIISLEDYVQSVDIAAFQKI